MTLEDLRTHVFKYRELQAKSACSKTMEKFRRLFPKGTCITRASLQKFNLSELGWLWCHVIIPLAPQEPTDNSTLQEANRWARYQRVRHTIHLADTVAHNGAILIREAILHLLGRW